VTRASVTVDGECIGRIGCGLVVLLGVKDGDSEEDVAYIAEKIAGLRVFADAERRMNLSPLEAGAAVLIISQFTLYGDARKGRRPSYSRAARPDEAQRLYERCAALIAERGLTVRRESLAR